jgi:hypothetical protein
MMRSLVAMGVLAGAMLLFSAMPAFAQTKGAAPGKGADACALVTKAEIQQAFGVQVNDGTKNPRMQNPGVLSSCDYQGAGGESISVLIRQNAVKYVPGTEKPEFEKQGMKLRPAPGIGASAFYMDMFGMGTGSVVFRGDYDYVQVSAMNAGAAKKVEAGVEKITRMVLDRWK